MTDNRIWRWNQNWKSSLSQRRNREIAFQYDVSGFKCGQFCRTFSGYRVFVKITFFFFMWSTPWLINEPWTYLLSYSQISLSYWQVIFALFSILIRHCLSRYLVSYCSFGSLFSYLPQFYCSDKKEKKLLFLLLMSIKNCFPSAWHPLIIISNDRDNFFIILNKKPSNFKIGKLVLYATRNIEMIKSMVFSVITELASVIIMVEMLVAWLFSCFDTQG